jgi:uncharacterized membrane protein
LDPITRLIDKTEELLGHSPHPAIVALPVGAWAVSNISDGLALLTGDERYDDAARISMGIGLVGAAAAAATGLRDYGYIPREKPSHEIATTHGLGNVLVGSLFTASYLLRTLDAQEGRRTSTTARLLGFAGGGLALYTAWLGGVLVHEQGEAVKPLMEHQDDEAYGRARLRSESPIGAYRG